MAGTTKVFDTSGLSAAELEKQVFAYAGELTGGADISATSKVGVWSATLADGTTINVRSVSSSNAGRWTVDAKGNPALQEIKPNYKENSYEIKFK